MNYTDLIEDFDDDFDDVEEIDIQQTVLKRRNKTDNQQIYVEYDRLTYSILAISPIKIEASTRRNKIEAIEPSQLTTKIFDNKVPLSKVIIKKNKDTGKLELHQARVAFKSEFDFVFATKEELSYFQIHCNVVSKNIDILFDYELFKLHFSQDRIVEKDLANFPDLIEIYCIDRNERSKLYDKITVKVFDLFQQHSLRYKATWLPNNDADLEKLSFVYYNDNQLISIGNVSKEHTNKSKYKPNILYSQEGNVLKLQSTMQNVNSFKLNDDLTLYPYAEHDPTMILGSIQISSDQFNNYNNIEIKLNTTKKIKLATDCFHLHIEESNVNSY